MLDKITLRVHAFLSHSRANGPGLRAVLWLQGCTLHCPGCFNPQTHSPRGGERLSLSTILARLLEAGDSIEGLTISGGEPLQQPLQLLRLLESVRAQTNLSTLLFSGYSLEEIRSMRYSKSILACLDVLIAGRYLADLPVNHALLGSANQTIHLLTGRYQLDDMNVVPEAEVVISPDGSILLSGIAPLTW